MIEITDKSLCTGCGACIAICPRDAIHYTEDEEGVRYPKIRPDRCIHCDKCDQVCPLKAKGHGVPEEAAGYREQYYAAKLKNEDDLMEVSSGGVFWALAEMMLDQNGIIYGAGQIDVDHIEHLRCDNKRDAAALRRSKYLQSDASKVYPSVKKNLEEGRHVLFCGTGCQVAGLNMYLGRSYETLLTADIVCHGVPCGLAWKSYRSEKEAMTGKKMVGLNFRDKSRGWQYNQYKITYDDGSCEYERSTEQAFHRGYLLGLFYRPSCGSCAFASLPRASDITLADFWRYKGRLLNDKGVSLTVVNTRKGEEALELSEKYLEYESVAREEAFNSCRHLTNAPAVSPERDAFMRTLRKKGYHRAIKKYVKGDSVPVRVLRKVKRWIRNG